MAIVTRNVVVDEKLAGRADRVVQVATKLSRSQINGIFDHGCVRVNGQVCKLSGKAVSAGDEITVTYDIHRRYRELARPWEDDSFKIVFEDQHLIVVDKTAAILTVPVASGDTNTLLSALSRYFEHLRLKERPQVVHRLDRGVSGLLVFAKSRAIAEKLQSQFEDRKPEREYIGIVKGMVPKSGRFESHLATSKSLQRFSTARAGEGDLAITHFELEKIAHGCSCVRVRLETGRRNQIRVHFAEAGRPVLGDPRYGTNTAHPLWRTKRIALHAATLGFRHPVSGEPLRFQSPIPGVMKSFMNAAVEGQGLASKVRGRRQAE